MNKKLLFFLCNIISLCYASEKPIEIFSEKCSEISSYIDRCSVKNQRPHQEDFSACVIDINKGELLVAVFDGHLGKEVARYMAHNVLAKFQYNLKCSLTEKQAFEKAFSDCEDHAIKNLNGGSTALVVYINDRTIHSANVGDSRAVCGNKNEVFFATCDQTMAREDERNRIIQANGIIYRYRDPLGGEKSGPWRINGLEMSRAMGDTWPKGKEVEIKDVHLSAHKIIKVAGLTIPFPLEQWPNIALPQGLVCQPQVGQVIADPEYVKHALTDEHRWLILATDGLWGDISNQKAIELVQSYYDETNSLAGIAQ